jgi:hypothetical protein
MAPNRRRGRAAAAAAVPPVAVAGRPRVAAIRARVARGARVAQSPPRGPSSPRGPGGSSGARRTSPPQAGECPQQSYEFIPPDASWSNPSVALSLAVSAAAVFATSAPGAAELVSNLVRQVTEGVAAVAGPDRGGGQHHPTRANPRPRRRARVGARWRCAACRSCPERRQCYHLTGRCFRCGATDHLVRQCPVAAPSQVAAGPVVRSEEEESSEPSASASGEPAPGISPSLTFVSLVFAVGQPSR